MDTVEHYRDTVEKVSTEYAQIPYAIDDIQQQTVFDRACDPYLLMSLGWDRTRVHGCLVHVDIIGNKLWIQRDGTEDGTALDLEAAGIPKDRIVLGFRSPEVRKHSGYAME